MCRCKGMFCCVSLLLTWTGVWVCTLQRAGTPQRTSLAVHPPQVVKASYEDGVSVTLMEGALGDGVGAKLWVSAHILNRSRPGFGGYLVAVFLEPRAQRG